jgi:glycosyltransferase involved in cell wall biosynthesis
MKGDSVAMKISVITATLNSAEFLQECITSVVRQEGGQVEHIIVDGGSTDDTLQIARANPHLRIIVRPGCGIYEAWNIGLDVATGDLIGFCNSDDHYAPNAFARIREEAAARLDAWMISGKAVRFAHRPAGDEVILGEHFDKVPNRLHLEDLDVFGPAPNARFFTRKLIARIGKFDTRFRLGSDCSYLMEIALLRLPVAHVPDVVYYYRSHGKSASLGGNIDGLATGLDEKLLIANEFIRKHGLQPAELRHLRRAMAVQLNSTIIEAVRTGHWRLAITLADRLRLLGAAGPIVLFGESCRFACRFVAKRARRLIQAGARLTSILRGRRKAAN